MAAVSEVWKPAAVWRGEGRLDMSVCGRLVLELICAAVQARSQLH